jgi:hypothetical protein
MGASDLSQIRRSRSGQTLRCRPEASPFTGGRAGQKRARGIAATPVAATERDEVLRRGTPRGLGTDVGRCPRQVTRASSDPASRCFSPPVPQSWGSGNPAAMDRDGTAPRQRGSCPGSVAEAASDQRRNPMDGSGPRGRKAKRGEPVEEVRNLEDGTSRGRQPRDDTYPPADVVEGESNPRRGWLQW